MISLSHHSRRLAPIALVLGLAACGGSSSKAPSVGTTDTMTQRERDSVLSQSSIPGARGVGAAMRVADSTSAGIRRRDTTEQ
jgi:hypothetical protein